jgi:hypothetical protein
MKKYIAMIILLLVVACSTSRITSSWKQKEEAPKQFKKIMVVSLAKESDGQLKQLMEDHLTNDLKTAGYNAVSVYNEYGPKVFKGMSEDSAVKFIRSKGFDAVMTIVLLDKKQEREYIPRKVLYTPYYMYHNQFWDYYSSTYSRVEAAGYYATTTEYCWESNFYDMNAKKLLYSVQTESFQPASINSLAHEYGKLIIKDMLKKEVLAGNANSTAIH